MDDKDKARQAIVDEVTSQLGAVLAQQTGEQPIGVLVIVRWNQEQSIVANTRIDPHNVSIIVPNNIPKNTVMSIADMLLKAATKAVAQFKVAINRVRQPARDDA